MHIAVHETFLDHRKMRRLSRYTGINQVHLRGHLITLWLKVQRHCPDGHMDEWDNEDIADFSEWDGDAGHWVDSLVRAELIEQVQDDSGRHYAITDAEQHFKLKRDIERRRKERERKRAYRLKKKLDAEEKTSQFETMSHGTNVGRPECPALRREEKIREEKIREEQSKAEHVRDVVDLQSEPSAPPHPEPDLPALLDLPKNALPPPLEGEGYQACDLERLAWHRGWRANKLSPTNIRRAQDACRRTGPWTADVIEWAAAEVERKNQRNPNLGLLLCILEESGYPPAGIKQVGNYDILAEWARLDAEEARKKAAAGGVGARA